MKNGKSKEEDLNVRITFKKDEKYLLDEIRRHSGKSNYVKDILKQHIPERQNKN